MEHEEYKELLALEAVGALSGEESRALGAHLATCAECRREAPQMLDAVSSLAYIAAPVVPPAYLRARVLDAVKALKPEAEDVVEIDDTDEKSGEGSRTFDGGASRAASKYGTWQLLASRPPLMYGALAAALVFAVLAGASALLWNRSNEYRAQVIRLSEDANKSRAEAARLSVEAERARSEAARAREVQEMLGAPGARLVHLAGTDVAPGARASMVFEPASGRALLLASALPPPPAGKAYQLWYIAGGPPQPGGTFTTDREGGSVMRDQAPDEARKASVFVVTLEPAGGVKAPTGDKYLLGSAS
ncbi:MAG: anti-sigma factor [Acidobacteria bacterium]|nr:anti-sigma factor [Acidobacteriota bacterium]